jgi:hypothetical protein
MPGQAGQNKFWYCKLILHELFRYMQKKTRSTYVVKLSSMMLKIETNDPILYPNFSNVTSNIAKKKNSNYEIAQIGKLPSMPKQCYTEIPAKYYKLSSDYLRESNTCHLG